MAKIVGHALVALDALDAPGALGALGVLDVLGVLGALDALDALVALGVPVGYEVGVQPMGYCEPMNVAKAAFDWHMVASIGGRNAMQTSAYSEYFGCSIERRRKTEAKQPKPYRWVVCPLRPY